MPLNFLVIALDKYDHSQSAVMGKGKLCCLSGALSPGMLSLQLRSQGQDAQSPRSPGSFGRTQLHGARSLRPRAAGATGPQTLAPARRCAGLLRLGCRAEPAGQTRRLTAYKGLSTRASKLSAPPHGAEVGGGTSMHVFVLSASPCSLRKRGFDFLGPHPVVKSFG